MEAGARHKYSPWQLPKILAWLLTFICVVFAWVFFRSESISAALGITSSMFSPHLESTIEGVITIDSVCWVIFSLLVALVFPNTQQLMRSKFQPIHVYTVPAIVEPAGVLQRVSALRIEWRIPWVVFLVFLGLVSVYFLLDTKTVNEFIYFQF